MKQHTPQWWLRHGPHTIHKKFLLSVIVASCAAMTLYGVLHTVMQYEKYSRELERKLETAATLATMTFENPVWHLDKPGVKATGTAFLEDREIGSVAVVSNYNDVLFNETKAGEPYTPRYLVEKQVTISSQEGEAIGTVTLGITSYYYQIALRQEVFFFALSMLVLLILQALLVTILSRNITRPLVELTKGTRAIAQGATQQKLLIESLDEIGELSYSFNQMSENLTKMISQRDEAALALENANSDLENKVLLRTLELKRVNEKLQDTNDEVNTANESLKSEMAVRIETEMRLKDLNVKLQETLQTLVDTQKQLFRSEKLSALTRLVSGVAHEINTPIGICITANSYLVKIGQELGELRESGNATEKGYRYYLEEASEVSDIIQRSLETAVRLINSLKILSGIKRQEPMQEFNVHESIHDVIAGVRKDLKENQVIHVNCASDILLSGSVEVLSQILSSLIANSLVHGFKQQNDGIITIDVEEKPGGVEILFRDDGIGISEEHLDKVFDPFFTTTRGKGNTGLGLFAVYEMLTLHFEGSVICESLPGEGVSFLLTFPRLKYGERDEQAS